MMRRLLYLLLLLAPFPLSLSAQTKTGIVSGTVKDSVDRRPLPATTVTIHQRSDSSMLAYRITDEDGSFYFTDVPKNVRTYIRFSSTGYRPGTLNLAFGNRDTLHFKEILLARSHELMEGIVIEVIEPVTMSGDTLEINPAAFKLDSNAVAEDILARVPGITLWGDGTITVNGVKVSNVYVDGKQFFGSDPAIATQNLPKHAIEKIQVYQEEDYSREYIEEEPIDSLLTMNIQLKADKRKGFFGKVGAGYGTDERYEADLSILTFTGKFRGGAAASTNNINKSAGLSNMLRQSTFRNNNPKNRNVANLNSSGINKVSFLGGNAQYDFSEQNTSRHINQLSGNYTYRNNSTLLSSQTDARNSATGTIFLEESSRNSVTDNEDHTANINYVKRSWDNELSIKTNFNSTSNSGTSISESAKFIDGGDEISRSRNDNLTSGQTNNVSLNTSFRNKDDDDRNLKSFRVNFNVAYSDNSRDRKTISDLVSEQDPTQNRSYNRLNQTDGSNFKTSLDVGYNALRRLLFRNFNLWGVNMTLNNNLSYSRTSANTFVGDLDPSKETYIRNEHLTYSNEIYRLEEKPSLRLVKNFSKRLTSRYRQNVKLAANVQGSFISDKNESNFAYRNIDRDYSFFTPSFSAEYSKQKFNRHRLTAGLSARQGSSIPSINQLYPIIDTSVNIYSVNLGNPDLKPAQTQTLNFNLEYQREQPSKKTDYNFNLSGSARNANNAVADSSLYDKRTGRRTVYLINTDNQKSYNAAAQAAFSLKLKNSNMVQFRYRGSFTNSQSANYIDNIFAVATSNTLSNSFSLFYSFGNAGNIEISHTTNESVSKQSAAQFKTLRTTQTVTQANLNIHITKDLTVSSTLDNVENSSLKRASTLWNAFLTYRFTKTKQAEIRLSALDILGQKQNFSTTAGLNHMTTTVVNGLEHFMMVTLSYYPRQFGGRGMRGGGSLQRGSRPGFRSMNR